MLLFSLNNVSLIVAGTTILDRANWQIHTQDKIALVGRNGAGKSTLLKLMQGNILADKGEIKQRSGLKIAGLAQEVPTTQAQSVYQFLVGSLGEVGQVLAQFNELTQTGNLDQLADCQLKMDKLHAWDLIPQIETMTSRLGIPIKEQMNNLSGGLKRRVLLGAALIAKPDLLLLDEPTNHLDIEAIEWLESYLKTFSGAVVLVTHDREFLAQTATSIVEIDRGTLYRHECNYETYLDRREAIRLGELRKNDLFDKKLAEEETWIRTGVKARRTRNEGRVRALKALREEHKARRSQLSVVKTIALDVSRSGSAVIEADLLEYAFPNKTIVKDFSLLLTRGDKLGIIGPNGCGKTTLIRLLLGSLKPDKGTIKLGTSLHVAYFDQLRSSLQEDQTLLYNVGDGADFVTVNGKQKHVASYLKEFLFGSEKFNQPVFSLSGGEKNRLLLAKLFAKPVNLLVMDEPTNDLDIETLELLEQLLMDYPGTLILISHDRAFINQVVTSVLVYEDEGRFSEFVGGYEDYKSFKKEQKEQTTKLAQVKNTKTGAKLSFNEQRELTQLPKKIEELEQCIKQIQIKMSDPKFYQQEAESIAKVSQELTDQEALLTAAFERWSELEDR